MSACYGMALIRAGLEADPARRPGLREFVASLRGALNRLLADDLARPSGEPSGSAPVGLWLRVWRDAGAGRFEPVAATHAPPGRMARDMRRVPAAPVRVRLRTGDRVRVEAVADRSGYLAVFNVGPAGQLNLLYPEGPPAPEPGRCRPHPAAGAQLRRSRRLKTS
jgi:hypothetical protein